MYEFLVEIYPDHSRLIDTLLLVFVVLYIIVPLVIINEKIKARKGRSQNEKSPYEIDWVGRYITLKFFHQHRVLLIVYIFTVWLGIVLLTNSSIGGFIKNLIIGIAFIYVANGVLDHERKKVDAHFENWTRKPRTEITRLEE